MGYITVDVGVGKQKTKGARTVITRDGIKSLIGRDWLTKLNFRVAKAKTESEYKNIVKNLNRKFELSPELKRKQKKFTNVFKRKGRIVGHNIKIEFQRGSKITQQNG